MRKPCVHCSNGGTCVRVGPEVEDYSCQCKAGFRGRHCESDINECETRLSLPCPSGARCMNTPGSYQCRCPHGQVLLQMQCVPKITCSDGPCQNGALCYTVPGEHRDYVCECTLGFQGIDCEKKVDLCTPDFCGQHGICFMTTSGPACHCSSSRSGKNCQIASIIPQNISTSNRTRQYKEAGASDLLELFSVGAAILSAIIVTGCVLMYVIFVLKRLQLYKVRADAHGFPSDGLITSAVLDTLRCRSWLPNENLQADARSYETVGHVGKASQARLERIKYRIDLALYKEQQKVRALSAAFGRTANRGSRASLHEMQNLLNTV